MQKKEKGKSSLPRVVLEIGGFAWACRLVFFFFSWPHATEDVAVEESKSITRLHAPK
jgi:hypothetical protein